MLWDLFVFRRSATFGSGFGVDVRTERLPSTITLHPYLGAVFPLFKVVVSPLKNFSNRLLTVSGRVGVVLDTGCIDVVSRRFPLRKIFPEVLPGVNSRVEVGSTFSRPPRFFPACASVVSLTSLGVYLSGCIDVVSRRFQLRKIFPEVPPGVNSRVEVGSTFSRLPRFFPACASVVSPTSLGVYLPVFVDVVSRRPQTLFFRTNLFRVNCYQIHCCVEHCVPPFFVLVFSYPDVCL